jgi:hypothetical protein
LDEVSNAVKLEMAQVLSPFNLQQLPIQLANKIHVLFELFITAISYNADTPKISWFRGFLFCARTTTGIIKCLSPCIEIRAK